MDDTTTPEHASASQPKRRPRETRELKAKFEVVVIDDEEGRKLHQIQSQAVFEASYGWPPTRSPPTVTNPAGQSANEAAATTNSLTHGPGVSPRSVPASKGGRTAAVNARSIGVRVDRSMSSGGMFIALVVVMGSASHASRIEVPATLRGWVTSAAQASPTVVDSAAVHAVK